MKFKFKFILLIQSLFITSGIVFSAEFMSLDEYAQILVRKKKLFSEIDLAIGIEVASVDFDIEEVESKLLNLKSLKKANRICLHTLEKKTSALSEEIKRKKRILANPRSLKSYIDASDNWCLNPWRSCQVTDELRHEIKKIDTSREAFAAEILEQKLIQKELRSKISKQSKNYSELSKQLDMLTGLAKMIKHSRDELLSREIDPSLENKEWIFAKMKMDPVLTLLGAMSFQKDPVFDPGEEFRYFYTQYQTFASKLNEQLHRRVGHLESVQQLASPIYYQNRFLRSIVDELGADQKAIDKIMNFYQKLALQLQWYKIAAAAIASGEVNGDDSMLFGGREMALAALEGAEGVTDEIPILKSIVRVLALAGVHYIHEKQLQDNQKYSMAANSFVNSQVFSYVEAEEIIKYLDIRKLAMRDDPVELCESLAVLWKQSMMSCERHDKLSRIQLTKSHRSIDSFVEEIRSYQSRYIKIIGKRFLEKLTKKSWSRRLFRWRNSLNGVLIEETSRS